MWRIGVATAFLIGKLLLFILALLGEDLLMVWLGAELGFTLTSLFIIVPIALLLWFTFESLNKVGRSK